MTELNRRPVALSEATVELVFRLRDASYFMLGASERLGCELVLNEFVPQSTGNLLAYVSVYDLAADCVLSDAMNDPDVADARIIGADGDSCLLELVVTGPTIVRAIADGRSIPRLVRADRGVGRVVVDVPPGGDPQRVITLFRERYADSSLVARRTHDGGPLFSADVRGDRILDRLTDRQRETLRTAYEMGYFERPRRHSAVDCAEALGISQSTFSQHIRVGLEKILEDLLIE